MVGGGQIGPNPETRGWIAPQQQVGDPFGQGGAYGHKRGPFQQGFGDPSKLATGATLDINYRDHYPSMEQRDPQQGTGDGAIVDQQRGNAYKQQPEWGQDAGGRVESEYQVAAGRDLSVSESSRSDASEDEEDEDDEDDDDEEDDDMVENDDEDKVGPEGVTDPQVVEGVSGVPLAHSGLDPAQIRPEHAFPRNMAERDRAPLKAAAIGTAGTSSSPFGMFQSSSSAIPFLNSFSSPSNAAPHAEGLSSQNGVGMAVIASASGAATASYSLTRDGGLSRDVVTRESSGFRETTVVTTTAVATATASSLQEPSGRMSSGPLHEQLQTTDVDNYYTTLLNTQTPPNNGLNKAAEAASRRIADPQSPSESSLRRILSDPLTGALMDDAMIISCGHSVGNAGRRRVMETSVCIICGASVRTEAMAPNYALRMVVQAFKREEEMNGNLSLRSAKRRRDTVQESIGLPDQAAADGAKVKGVQFPFVVSDRVMIKGNKRTPERFVGREAVITTQCLNGWYLVRTLDTGESVRLQYRSLQKLGVSREESGPAIAEFADISVRAVCVQ